MGLFYKIINIFYNSHFSMKKKKHWIVQLLTMCNPMLINCQHSIMKFILIGIIMLYTSSNQYYTSYVEAI